VATRYSYTLNDATGFKLDSLLARCHRRLIRRVATATRTSKRSGYLV
jgi:hypothetical protein